MKEGCRWGTGWVKIAPSPVNILVLIPCILFFENLASEFKLIFKLNSLKWLLNKVKVFMTFASKRFEKSCRFKNYLQHVRDLRWCESLTMVLDGNRLQPFHQSIILQKQFIIIIHHHHHQSKHFDISIINSIPKWRKGRWRNTCNNMRFRKNIHLYKGSICLKHGVK